MASRLLYRKHDPASQTKYQDLKQLARTQTRVLSGTPGTLKQRTQAGKRYWVREHIRVDGRKTDEYIGPESKIDKAMIEKLQAELSVAKTLASGSASLRLFGFQRIDRKPAAVLEVFFNRGLIEAGLTLVGSNAYGALLNELGIIAPGYKTQDIDVARAQPLAVAFPANFSLRELLNETGLSFVPLPGMPSHRPSASFKLPGAELLAVDLLVPGKNAGDVIPVNELAAHAQTVPLLDFLVHDPVDSLVLSPNQIIPVRVPAPERFVLHKLFSSQSRRADRDKIRKDLDQAATLAAALEEQTPRRLRDVFRRFPSSGKVAVKRGACAAAKLLNSAHPEAKRALLEIAGR
jgi:hypothetical protein